MESFNTNKICRLCLKNCEGDFLALDKTILSKLHSILPYLDIAITDEPIVCELCSTSIKYYVDFKQWVRNPDPTTSSSRDGDNPSFKLEDDSDNCNSCLFCREVLERVPYIYLENYEVEMLPKYLPELTLYDIQSTMCMACLNCLKRQFNFIRTCVQAEENIAEYCNIEGTNDKGQIDLHDVVNFVSRNEFKRVPNIVKAEEIYMNNEINSDTKYERNIEDLSIKVEEDCNIKDKKGLIGCQKDIKKCGKCIFNDRFYNYLRQQNIVYENGEVATKTCQLCADQSNTSHRRSAEEAIHKCPECTFETKSKDRLVRHMVTHKSRLEMTMFNCAVCEFQTDCRRGLLMHMLTHKAKWEVRTYKCRSCKFQTEYQRSLLRHLIIHKHRSKGPIFRCAVCNFTSKHQSRLYKHVSGHRAALDETTNRDGDVPTFQMEVDTPIGDL